MKISAPMVYGGLALVGLALAYKFAGVLGKGAQVAADVAGGIVSGNNAVTAGATNAAGERTTAYQGAGIAGTVGAATNAASGGILASVGESLGGWWASVTGADKDAEVAAMLKGTPQTAAQSRYNRPPLTSGTPASTDTSGAPVIVNTSFKDQANPDAINWFHDPTPYGGGISLR